MSHDAVAILVVDDNPPMVQTLADILETKGFVVFTARGGAEALAILHSQQIDLLLTDVVMPDMNGVQLYRLARESHPHLITFLMTAYSADEIIRQGMAEGIKTVLNKPLDINLLLMLIEAVDAVYVHAR